MKISKQFTTGILVGVAVTCMSTAIASSSILTKEVVQAVKDIAISFNVNGELTKIPEDLGVLIYGDRVYVPVRNAGVILGKQIGWNSESRTITIKDEKTTEAETTTKEIVLDPEDEDEKVIVRTAPARYSDTEFELTVESVRGGEDSRILVNLLPRVENAYLDFDKTFVYVEDSDKPLKINWSYVSADLYGTLEEDKTYGFTLRFLQGDIPEDAEYIRLELNIKDSRGEFDKTAKINVKVPDKK